MVLCKTEQFLNPFGLFIIHLEFFFEGVPRLAGSGAARLRLIEPLASRHHSDRSVHASLSPIRLVKTSRFWLTGATPPNAKGRA